MADVPIGLDFLRPILTALCTDDAHINYVAHFFLIIVLYDIFISYFHKIISYVQHGPSWLFLNLLNFQTWNILKYFFLFFLKKIARSLKVVKFILLIVSLFYYLKWQLKVDLGWTGFMAAHEGGWRVNPSN